MSLSNKKVAKFLKKYFVFGWRNIAGEESYAGTSNTHLPSYEAQTVTNCSGHHNVQMFFMTTDGKVLNCLPGYWNPEALLSEAKFSVSLNKLYTNKRLSIANRNEKFLNAHLEKAFFTNSEVQEQSTLQGFDKKNIEMRSDSDFKRTEGFIDSGLKKTDQILHERMAERPFLTFEMFDTPNFIDMGRKQYAYNKGVPGHEKPKQQKTKQNKNK